MTNSRAHAHEQNVHSLTAVLPVSRSTSVTRRTSNRVWRCEHSCGTVDWSDMALPMGSTDQFADQASRHAKQDGSRGRESRGAGEARAPAWPGAADGIATNRVTLGIGCLPAATTWRHIGGLATVAGVGFTVAMFVTSLNFDDAAATDAATVGILIASTLAAAAGYLLLRSTAPTPTQAGDPAPAARPVLQPDAVPA